MRGKKADLVQRLVFIYAVLSLKTDKAVSLSLSIGREATSFMGGQTT